MNINYKNINNNKIKYYNNSKINKIVINNKIFSKIKKINKIQCNMIFKMLS